jgi:thiamine kinase-like enzyme
MSVDATGDTVRREAGPWTPAVHALLRHLEAKGFEGAPRVVGIDPEGFEILTYVPGVAPRPPAPAADSVVFHLGRLLRSYHDATTDFEAPADAQWQIPGAGEVICHNDLYARNIVFRDGLPVALIDFEFAGPGLRLTDVASAAAFWAPLKTDEEAGLWGLPVDRRGRRLRLLCDAYGLITAERRQLLEAVAAYLRRGYELQRQWGLVERRPKWAEMWEAGSGRAIEANTHWLAKNRAQLDRSL